MGTFGGSRITCFFYCFILLEGMFDVFFRRVCETQILWQYSWTELDWSAWDNVSYKSSFSTLLALMIPEKRWAGMTFSSSFFWQSKIHASVEGSPASLDIFTCSGHMYEKNNWLNIATNKTTNNKNVRL